MHPARTARVLGVLGAVLLPLTIPVWGCNAILGIEEQGERPDGSEAAAPISEGGSSAATCTQDSDCVAPDACYTPHCDSDKGRCWFGLCEVAGKACAAGTCDPSTRTCTGTTEYGFRTTSYASSVPACTDPSDCVASSWPFLFIGTTSGVSAMYVDDPIATGPRTIPVSGFTGAIAKLVVSGSRLWILGAPTASDGGASTTVRIGYVDLPTDPKRERLEATAEDFDVPFGLSAFPAPDGAIYVAISNGTLGFASALLVPPLPQNRRMVVADAGAPGAAGVVMYPAADLAPGSGVLVASSGARLIVHEPPSTYFAITSPGSASARAQAKLVTTFAPAAVSTFAQDKDGALLGVGVVQADTENDCGCTTVARARWLFANKDDVAIDQTTAADVETYKNRQNDGQPCHSCAAGYFLQRAFGALLDSKTALVAAPAEDPTATRMQTAVRLVKRDPVTVDPQRRFVIPSDEIPSGNFNGDRVAVTANRGIGYVVISNPANQARVSIFDPACVARAK